MQKLNTLNQNENYALMSCDFDFKLPKNIKYEPKRKTKRHRKGYHNVTR